MRNPKKPIPFPNFEGLMSETVAETYTAAENKFRIEMLDLSLEELKAAIQLFLAAPAGLAKGAIRA